MAYAIIRGKNGRRHEVDFGDAPVRVEVYASEESVEIFVEADFETHAEEHRWFAIVNIPGHLFKARFLRTSPPTSADGWAGRKAGVLGLRSASTRGAQRNSMPTLGIKVRACSSSRDA